MNHFNRLKTNWEQAEATVQRFIPAWLNTDRICLFFLVLITIMSHRYWFIPGTILHFTDWMMWSQTGAAELYKTWTAWLPMGNLGVPNISIVTLPYNLVWSLLASSGISQSTGLQITHLIPIALLSVVSPFIFARVVIKNQPIEATVSALFFATITYLLARETSHLPVAMVFCLAPLLLTLINVALRPKSGLLPWLGLAVMYTFAMGYELRIVFLITPILIAYALLLHGRRVIQELPRVALTVAVIVLLNLYWVLPTLFGSATESIGEIASRGLFGSAITNMRHALTIFDWSWTGNQLVDTFVAQPIPVYLWAVPIVAIAGVLAVKKRETIPQVLFFGSLSLIGIFLVKQEAEPLRGVYKWLYDNAPGFELYRESSKFHLLTALGYLGLISLSLGHLRSLTNRWWYRGAIVVLCGVAAWNMRPLVNGSIRALFEPRHQPADYQAFNQMITGNDTWYRTLSVPRFPQWLEFSAQHPRLGLADQVSKDWASYRRTTASTNISALEEMMAPLRAPYGHNLLNQSGVRYVVLTLDDVANQDTQYRYYAPRQAFSTALSEIPYLTKVDRSFDQLIVWENKQALPKYYLTTQPVVFDTDPVLESGPTVSVREHDSGRALVTITGARGMIYLQQAERFSAGWNLVAGSGLASLVKPQNVPGMHTKTDFGLNQYKIDPEALLAQNVPGVSRAADGSITITATLLFNGQPWLYLGVLISGCILIIVLGACIGLMLRTNYRNRHETIS